jgi:UDP-N-acetylmuramoyl-L-alanyl-D-glutamate--2,6-diaminopimelate ligase
LIVFTHQVPQYKRPMKLKELVESLDPNPMQKNKQPLAFNRLDPVWRDVREIQVDSRLVLPDDIFFALKGSQFDSHNELESVCQREPAAVVVESRDKVPASYRGLVLQVPSSRRALAQMAARFNDNPSMSLFCFGVTGTNGKTSCTYLMEKILSVLHLPTGIIGTIQHKLRDQVWPTEATTPGPLELQKRIREMKEAGAKALAIEVSSHALAQYRADGIHFNAVLFTNLTRDHLDYHQTMENYFHAKQRLFTDLVWDSRKGPIVAAVRSDDEWGRRLKVAFPAEVLTFGQKPGADFLATISEMSFAETKFKLQTHMGAFQGTIPLCGRYNVDNVVGCVASALALGISPSLSLQALENFAGVPGRLQRVPNNRGLHVFIDYAHTPDALENVLLALRKVRADSKLDSKITLVFGCGGDRDTGKRPLMAQVAEKWVDRIVVTSDNPRTEDPALVLRQIESGFASGTERQSILDRREAIAVAIKNSQAGDVVVIAGKGHEDYQIIGTEKMHFSDYEVAGEFLR